MKKKFTDKFSLEWVEAWNSHDLDIIMTHYAEDIEMNSPVIKLIMNESSGKVQGKKELRKYWEKALNMNPSLHFEVISTFSGTNSLAIHYKGHRGLSAEVFFFNDEGKVNIAHAHYE